jgi:diaminopimelate decarboxylase
MDSYLPSRKIAENIALHYGTPAFITSAEILQDHLQQMLSAFPWKKKKILYAIKANPNPVIVKTLKDSGIHGVDTVCPHEVQLALDTGFCRSKLSLPEATPVMRKSTSSPKRKF